MTERDKLIDEFHKIFNKECFGDKEFEAVVADWVIADRKRVVEPLIEWNAIKTNYAKEEHAFSAIRITLKNAGVTHER